MTELDIDPARGLVASLGLQLDEVSPQRVTAHLDVTEQHLQPYGVVHGGVYCTIAETVASIGAHVAASAREPGLGAVGLENHTSFLRTVGLGARIVAEALPRSAGRRQQHWTVVMRDGDGRELALSTVRLLVVDHSAMTPQRG